MVEISGLENQARAAVDGRAITREQARKLGTVRDAAKKRVEAKIAAEGAAAERGARRQGREGEGARVTVRGCLGCNTDAKVLELLSAGFPLHRLVQLPRKSRERDGVLACEDCGRLWWMEPELPPPTRDVHAEPPPVIILALWVGLVVFASVGEVVLRACGVPLRRTR